MFHDPYAICQIGEALDEFFHYHPPHIVQSFGSRATLFANRLCGKFVRDNLTVKEEFARTTDVWLGTFNPSIPQFAASKVTSFDIGAKYRYNFNDIPLYLSAEFSRFKAGPGGAPREKQDQLVIGSAWFVRPNVSRIGSSACTFAVAIITAASAPPSVFSVAVFMVSNMYHRRAILNSFTCKHRRRNNRSDPDRRFPNEQRLPNS